MVFGPAQIELPVFLVAGCRTHRIWRARAAPFEIHLHRVDGPRVLRGFCYVAGDLDTFLFRGRDADWTGRPIISKGFPRPEIGERCGKLLGPLPQRIQNGRKLLPSVLENFAWTQPARNCKKYSMN